MPRLWLDLWDLLRLKVRALDQYRHPWWLMALVLTAMGVIDSADTVLPGASVAARVVVFVLFDWLEALALCSVLLLWLRLSPRRARFRPLFTLLLLCELPQLLSPLASWLPDELAQMAQVLLWGLTLALTVYGVARATSIAARRVAIGVLLFLPLSVALFAAVTSFGALFGWLPPAPADDATQTSSPAASSSSSTSDSDEDFAP